MRITVKPNDKDYTPPEHRRNVKIYLDGVAQNYVETADEEQGLVIKIKLDDNGNLVTNNDELIYERLRGVVEIKGAQ